MIQIFNKNQQIVNQSGDIMEYIKTTQLTILNDLVTCGWLTDDIATFIANRVINGENKLTLIKDYGFIINTIEDSPIMVLKIKNNHKLTYKSIW